MTEAHPGNAVHRAGLHKQGEEHVDLASPLSSVDDTRNVSPVGPARGCCDQRVHRGSVVGERTIVVLRPTKWRRCW